MKVVGTNVGIVGVRFSPHTLRHSFAVGYVCNGGNLFYLSKILLHTSVETNGTVLTASMWMTLDNSTRRPQSVIIADKMSKIREFRNLSNDELYQRLEGGGPPDDYQLATQELQRRYLIEIGKQTASLAASSAKMEKLTCTLKTLTIDLVILTVAAISTPIGIEIWKACTHQAMKHPLGPV